MNQNFKRIILFGILFLLIISIIFLIYGEIKIVNCDDYFRKHYDCPQKCIPGFKSICPTKNDPCFGGMIVCEGTLLHITVGSTTFKFLISKK